MSKQVYSIVICDSQYLIVEALKTIIDRWPEYAVQGYANNIRDLNEKLQTLKPDFLITDFRTIERVAFETVGNIMKEFTDLHTIILTNQLNRNELNELNRIGIKSILYKTATDDDIKAALDAALKNKKYYSDEVLDVLMDVQEEVADNKQVSLTPTELEIVKLIANGLTTKEIAEQKHVSFHTIVSHRKNIFRKLEINSVSELVVYALRSGLSDSLDFNI